MKNVLVIGLAAFALVGCGSTAEDAGAVSVVEEGVETVAEENVEADAATVLEEAKAAAEENQAEKSVADGEAQPE